MTARPTPEDTRPSSSETMVLLGRRWCPQRQRGLPVRVIGEKIVDLRVPTIFFNRQTLPRRRLIMG